MAEDSLPQTPPPPPRNQGRAQGPQGSRSALVAAWCLAVAAALALGTQVRLDDPLSTTIIPAEDPYTHMALVREHLRDGGVEPLHEGSTLYPPGLHVLLGATLVFTGADLYDIVRFGPAVLGALGLLGVAVFLWRLDSPMAAAVGTLALALAPEAIFRTSMMSPTALDLALLPFLLFSLLRTAQGRLGWAVPAAVGSAFLVFAHPWVLALLGPAGLAFVLLAFAMPWPAARGLPVTGKGLAAAAAIVGCASAVALTGCQGNCGPGFSNLVPRGHFLAGHLDVTVAPAIAVLSLVPLVVEAVWPGALERAVARTRRPRPPWANILLGAVLAGLLVGLTLPALAGGLPRFVDPPRNFGWPILLLAAGALAALPFIARPSAHLAAALFAATYPFVIYNPLASPFWPHRTGVYLCLALALLAGTAAGALARAAMRSLAAGTAAAAGRVAARIGAPAPAPGRPPPRLRAAGRTGAVLLPAVVVTVCLAGGVYAYAPDPYPPWYRLFGECEFEALREVAQATDEPGVVVVTTDWQSKLIVAALASDASRVWYHAPYFVSPDERERLARDLPQSGFLAVSTRYASANADLAFMGQDPWQLAGAWCQGDAAVQAARLEARA